MSLRKTKSGKIPEEPIDSTVAGKQPTFRTPLGKRLWAIRQRAIAAGLKLLSGEEIEREILRRRGESAQ